LGKKNNPGSDFITHAECARNISKFNGQIKKNTSELITIKKALVGEDMRGGLVADVQTIKSATSFLKTTVLPIVLSVASAIIVYVVLNS
jgi:hypothetical protein